MRKLRRAASGSYPLSGFESVNLFSGGLNVSLPLLKIGGRGEAGLVLSKTLETRWSTTRNQIGSGSDYFVYVNHGGASHGQVGYGPGFLEVRTDIKEDVCGANQIYHQQSLTRLHWNGADGQDVDLVDKGTSGAAQGTGVVCGSGQLSGRLAYFNRGREFVSRNGSGVTYFADAPGGIKDNDGAFFPGLAQFYGFGSRIQANLGSAVSAMTTWRLELELRNVFPTNVNSIVWTSGGLSLSIEKNGASNYFLRFSGSGLNGQLTFNLSNSVTAPIIRIQRGADGVYIAQCWDPSDRTVPLPATASPTGWNNQAMTAWNFASTPLYLGANASLTNNYQGSIDFVRFYNSTLISNDAPYLRTGSEIYSYEFDANFNDSSVNAWHLTQATGITLTSNIAATTGTLFFSNGMRIHTFNGRPDWIADRNGNRIQLYSENDVYQRITRIVDSVGRTVSIEYTNNPAHLGEEWIRFTGSGGTPRIVKVRHLALSSLFRDAESVQEVRQLFRKR